jgi:hypothetical protein
MFPTNQGPRIPLPQPRERGCEDFAWDAQKSGELGADRRDRERWDNFGTGRS